MEEKAPVNDFGRTVLRYTAASKIGNSVISLLWQLRCRCNPDKNKFSSSSNTTVVAIFSKLCLWRRRLCWNLRGIDPEKLYRDTLSNENTYVLDIINSNRKFDISLDGTLLSPSTNLHESLCFNSSCTNLLSQSTEREKISTLVAIFDVRDMSTFSLLNTPNKKIRSYLVRPNISTHKLSGLHSSSIHFLTELRSW